MDDIRDITAFALDWCRRRNLPHDVTDDCIQEAHLAALVDGAHLGPLVRAMDRTRKRQFRQPVPLSTVCRSSSRVVAILF
jgi:hypothetical protein